MREREAKLVVPDDFRMPAPEDLAPHVSAGAAETVEQGAIYYDTEDLRLTRSGVSLRFRSDDGWTVKLPEGRTDSTLVRAEHHFAGEPGSPPSAASELVRSWTRTEPLIEVARITTHRRRVRLSDENGRLLAELDDDRVTGSASIATKTRFREIEVELAEDAPAKVLNALVKGLHAAGARPAPAMSKVARVLGEAAHRPPDLADAPRPPDATARDLVRTTMLRSVTEILERDPQLRLSDDVETVHKARVATRRLRSDLKTFRPILERGWSEPLRSELKWLGGLLGQVRDADVLLESLTATRRELPDELQTAGDGLIDRLHTARAHDRDALLEALRSLRYARLLEWLVVGTNDPGLRPGAGAKRADAIVGRLTRPPRKRLARRVERLGRTPTNGELHDVRKRAKQARYACEAVERITGQRRVAKRLAHFQDVLGRHQDAVVAIAWLLDASRDAETRGDEGFVAGQLAGILIAERGRAREQWRKAWKRAR